MAKTTTRKITEIRSVQVLRKLPQFLRDTFKSILFDYTPHQTFHYLLSTPFKRQKAKTFDDEHPCVFVLSTGRVGTQTLSSLFQFARNVFAYHEPKPSLYGLSQLAYEFSDNAIVSKVLLEAFVTSRQETMRYSLSCNRGYIEASPQATFLAPLILNAIPETRFIHIVRDPRHVVRSAMRRKWYDGNPADRTRIAPNPDSKESIPWDNYSPFQKNLWLWAETNKWILDFASTLPERRMLMIRGEDVFSAQQEAMYKLFSFIGSPVPSKHLIASVIDKRLNMQTTGTFPEVNDWPDALRSDLVNIGGEIADMLGYHI